MEDIENEKPSTDAPVTEEPALAATGEDAPLAAGLEIGSQAATEAEPVKAPLLLRGKTLPDGTVVATGRRKTAVARVRIKKGDGKFVVNNRQLDEFFCIERDRIVIQSPLRATETLGQVDVWVRVNGGGTTGQAGAILLGLARALQAYKPESHSVLSEGGFLTRDGRMVERKKYGHKKARRSFQFSKR